MKYRYRFWCRYCRGEEDSVCGGDSDFSDELFDTPELADVAAREFTNDTCYDYDITDENYHVVIDEDGNVVEEDEDSQI